VSVTLRVERRARQGFPYYPPLRRPPRPQLSPSVPLRLLIKIGIIHGGGIRDPYKALLGALLPRVRSRSDLNPVINLRLRTLTINIHTSFSFNTHYL
jgi:hypothetical protein